MDANMDAKMDAKARQPDLVGRGWAFPLQLNDQGGLHLVGGYTEIDQAIRIILGTMVGERVMRPEFGSRLHELVFAPINAETMAMARRYVEDALTIWEPRIALKQVLVLASSQTAGRLAIDIQYVIKSTGDQRSLVYPFYTIGRE
jgi:phage baseplate assembly protein W